MMILGTVYFVFKMASDAIWLLHLFRSEFENPGLLMKTASFYLFFALTLLQGATMVKFIGDENFEAATVVIGAIVLSILSYNHFSRNLVTPEVLSYDRIYPSKEQVSKWRFDYQHPLEKEDFKSESWRCLDQPSDLRIQEERSRGL